VTTKSYSIHTSAHYCTTAVPIHLCDTLPCEQHLLNNIQCTMMKNIIRTSQPKHCTVQ